MNMAETERKISEQIRNVQFAIKLLVLVIFLGYMMIWIMMPTNIFWLHWLPHIYTATASTYFGLQGANLLIYSFPILLIATLGCLHLHLGKYVDDSDTRVQKAAYSLSWNRPVLVRGPLGIISLVELSFLLMFVALLVWSFSAYVVDMFKNITREAASAMNVSVWELKLRSAALLLGLVGNVCLAFLFFPVTRGSSVLRLLGLTSESTIKYHIFLGHTALTLFTAHGLCYVVFWARTNQISEMIKWNKIGISNVAGEVALVSGLIMWITSFTPVRRKIFELFFYTHHLYMAFVVSFVLHVGFPYSCIMLPGFYLFMIDRYLRFLQSQQRVRLVSARILPCQTMELNFSKDPRLSYKPSSIMFVNVKSVSKLQWHPFTVISNNNTDPDKLSVAIRCEGRWSQKLYQKLSSQIHRLEVSVEGPYGPASTSFLRHEMLVMVSGGSGITPFISIIRELLFLSRTPELNIPKVLLVSAFKKSEDLAMLELLLPDSGTFCNITNLKFRIQAYVTREKTLATENPKQSQTIYFRPDVLDRPVSSILGSNSWIWLGTIISCSFLIFLILTGLLTRYYIYPIDHNTNQIYSYTAKSLFNMLFLCVSIVIAATLVFLWNKKQNAIYVRQIQSADSPTSIESPGPESWPHNFDTELESLPHQLSLEQFTTIHFGQRPDLKKILLEFEELKVGVLVSGPKKMRQDTAAICSSSLAKNLSYESFSFNW
ncbi:ferric reduction oxidase 2 [Dorcoceras hygrometricum]|uniref:ferric-chelate reductase (NADH) n=1 Tax=Dorcoceras hygrometricum TaxID=472368 RepID=A0A2Z7BS51_9LAMI|nr:ferric reduction oxidase 2 [Dorcoceras hygrometricum]